MYKYVLPSLNNVSPQRCYLHLRRDEENHVQHMQYLLIQFIDAKYRPNKNQPQTLLSRKGTLATVDSNSTAPAISLTKYPSEPQNARVTERIKPPEHT